MTKKGSLNYGQGDRDAGYKEEHAKYQALLEATRKLTVEQIDKMVNYLKGTRNSIDDACRLVGVKFDDIDEASMIDFNMRVSQCRNCFKWLDLSELNENDTCFQCIDGVKGFLDNYDGQD